MLYVRAVGRKARFSGSGRARVTSQAKEAPRRSPSCTARGGLGAKGAGSNRLHVACPW